MGYNLNRLKNQYGVSTASKAQYAGQRNPGAEFSYNESAVNADKEAITEAAQRATYDANKAKFEADKAAYDAYSAQYGQRLQGTPMYANKQYQTQKEAAPNTINEMYQKYLGRENENNPARNAETEFAQRGINNTGNQNVMNQSGKYYGNVLNNPIYSSSSIGVPIEDATGTIITQPVGGTDDIVNSDGTPVDANGVPIDPADLIGIDLGLDDITIDTPVDANGVPIDPADLIGIDLGLDDITIDMSENAGVDGGGNSNNDNDPFDFPTVTPTGNSFSEDIANLNFWDDASYVNGVLTDNNTGFAVDESDIGTGGTYSGSGNSDYNDPGYEGDGGFNLFDWNTWQEGGHIRGYAEGDPVVDMRSEVLTDEEIIAANDAAIAQINNAPAEVVDIETITDVTPLDDLAAQQIAAQQTSGSNIDELRTMLATSNVPSAGGVSSARGALDTARADFSAMLKNAADTAGAGPSESEKWFRLAAAFGAPTQSGHFMENLGLANRELADVAKDRRAAGAAKNALLMEGAQFNIEYLKEDLLAATATSARERDYKRGLASDLLKWEQESARLAEEREFDLAVLSGERAYEDGKPKSEAAKIATDMGLEGIERANYIKKYYDDKNAISALEIESLNKNINSLSSGELNLKVETEGIIDSATDTLTKLDRALQLNSMAYTDSTWDRITQSVIGGINPDDPNVVATQEMENILKGISLASLKSTFGGAGITDSERRSLDALQGANSKSEEVRAKIFREAAKTAATILTRQRNRLADINTGAYGQKTTATGDE